MTKTLFSISLFTLLLWNCKDHTPGALNKTNYSNIPRHSIRAAQLVTSIPIDTLWIDAGNENQLTSMEGQFILLGDTLCFADRGQSTLFLYDLEGNFLANRLSKGKGPQEVMGIHKITPLRQGGYAILEDWHLNIFDQNWEGKKQFQIDWQNTKSPETLMQHPGPDESGIYETDYSTSRFCPLGDYLAMGIVTDCITYNGFRSNSQAAHFYENSYTLGLIDPTNGKIVRMMCTHSPVYQHYHYIPNFKSILFDTDTDNTLFYSFQADSLIYQMDFKNNTLSSFGVAGQPMNTDYRETNDFEIAESNFREDYKQFGYYRNLKYIPQTGLLFRSVYHGMPSGRESIQAYEEQTLVAEFQVPHNFEVFGYSAPYYYAYGKPDLDAENMVIYKFKLEI